MKDRIALPTEKVLEVWGYVVLKQVISHIYIFDNQAEHAHTHMKHDPN